MSKYTAVLSSEDRMRSAQVMRLWAMHQGWPDGGWPKDRRHDAIQIQHWTRLLGLPVEFWADVITRVPVGRVFRWLTTPAEKGRVSLLQEQSLLFIAQREQRRREMREAELTRAADAEGKGHVDDMVGTLAKRMRMRVA
jgi:hypothetical protein